MSEQNPENKKYFDPDFDTMITRKQSHQALMTRITYEVNRRHRMEDPPPPGYGLDGYPLQPMKEVKHADAEH